MNLALSFENLGGPRIPDDIYQNSVSELSVFGKRRLSGLIINGYDRPRVRRSGTSERTLLLMKSLNKTEIPIF